MKAGWTTVSLGDVAYVNPRDPKLDENESVSFVGMAELDGSAGKATPRETRSFGEVAKGYTLFRDRDLLLAKITPCWENGKIGLAYLNHRHGSGSTEFHVVRPTPSIDPMYLLHFLRQESVIAAGAMRMTGSGGQRRVPVQFVKELRIPLPPLHEQRHIAEMLDSVSTTYRRVQTIGPRLQAAERAVVSRAPWGPGRWSTIGESLKLQSGATLPATRRIPGGVPVYGANGVIGEHDQTTHDAARVTIGRVGAVGAVNITSGPAWISDNALIVKEAPGHVTNAYLYHSLTLADLGRYASQSAQPLITQSKIAEAPLWIPSPGAAARMQETLMRLEKMRGVAVEHENRAQALFASLQSRAFRGEL